MLVTGWASILVTIMIQLQSAYADLGRKVISRLPNQLVLPDQTEPMAMHYFFEQPEQDNGPSKLKWTNEEVQTDRATLSLEGKVYYRPNQGEIIYQMNFENTESFPMIDKRNLDTILQATYIANADLASGIGNVYTFPSTGSVSVAEYTKLPPTKLRRCLIPTRDQCYRLVRGFCGFVGVVSGIAAIVDTAYKDYGPALDHATTTAEALLALAVVDFSLQEYRCDQAQRQRSNHRLDQPSSVEPVVQESHTTDNADLEA